MDLLKDIQDWYLSNCDENWEHEYGVKIDTLDNPGWSVVIDLTGTSPEISTFQEINHEFSENDWYQCKVENDQFIGYGDPGKLSVLLQSFLDWAKPQVGWLKPPVYETTEDENLRFWKSLDEEVANEKCKVNDCQSNRIKYSVLCKNHHYEQYKQVEDVESELGNDA